MGTTQVKGLEWPLYFQVFAYEVGMFSNLFRKHTSRMNHEECCDALFEGNRPTDDILWLNTSNDIKSDFQYNLKERKLALETNKVNVFKSSSFFASYQSSQDKMVLIHNAPSIHPISKWDKSKSLHSKS